MKSSLALLYLPLETSPRSTSAVMPGGSCGARCQPPSGCCCDLRKSSALSSVACAFSVVGSAAKAGAIRKASKSGIIRFIISPEEYTSLGVIFHAPAQLLFQHLQLLLLNFQPLATLLELGGEPHFRRIFVHVGVGNLVICWQILEALRRRVATHIDHC